MALTPPAAAMQRHAHASGLHALSAALGDLHRAVLRSSGDESTQVRLSVVNIVAACNDATFTQRAADALVSIAARHPARGLIVVGDPDAPAHIESDVSLVGTGVGRQYMELVRLDIGGEPAYHLASIVTPLLIPDIPVHLWLVGSAPSTQAFREEAVALCDRIILDTGAYADASETLQLVASKFDTYGVALSIGDIAWQRIRPWREAVAIAFDGPEVRPWLRYVAGVEVVSTGATPSTDAWLFAGWLASRLPAAESASPDIGVSSIPSDGMRPGDIVAVRIRCERAHHAARVRLSRRAGSLMTSIDIDDGVVTTGTMALIESNEGELIALLMSDAGHDPMYGAAVARATRLSATQEP